MTPLDIFIDLWRTLIPAAAVPYTEAVNTQVDTNALPDIWGAAMYQPEAATDVTLGSQPWVEETGTFLIGLFTRSGNGPAALDAAVDAVRRAFHGVRRDGLLILQVDGPHDIDPDGTGEWWQLALTARYVWQTRRDATGPLYGGWQGFPDAPTPPGP
jgi:Bacteriophage related domain of unknown function